MDNWKHFGRINNPIYLQVGRVEVFPLVNSLFIVISFCKALIVSLIEAIDFVLHIFA